MSKELEYHETRICGKTVDGEECGGRLIRFGLKKLNQWKCEKCDHRYYFGKGERKKYRFVSVETGQERF